MARLISCLRGFLLCFVVVLGFSGLIVSGGAGVCLYKLNEYSLLTPDSINGPPASLVCLGLLTCVLAWFIWHFDYSCKSQVISLAGLIVLVGTMETGVGIWSIVRYQQLYVLPDKVVLKALYTLYDPKSEDIWTKMHTRVNCCGVNGAHEDFRQKHKSVPWSCCYRPPGAGYYDDDNDDDDGRKCERGCHHPMIWRTQSMLLYVFFLGLGSVVLKACVVAIAWCYAKAIAESLHRRKQELRLANTAAVAAAAAAAAASRSSRLDTRGPNYGPPAGEKSRPSLL